MIFEQIVVSVKGDLDAGRDAGASGLVAKVNEEPRSGERGSSVLGRPRWLGTTEPLRGDAWGTAGRSETRNSAIGSRWRTKKAPPGWFETPPQAGCFADFAHEPLIRE